MKTIKNVIFYAIFMVLLSRGYYLDHAVFSQSNDKDYRNLISDNLFLYSSTVLSFDTRSFLLTFPGPLKDYSEVIGDRSWPASEIIENRSIFYGINPQLLLIILDAQYNVLTDPDSSIPKYLFAGQQETSLESFFGYVDHLSKVLLKAYDEKRYGEAYSEIILSDGNTVFLPVSNNAGTYAVKIVLAESLSVDQWDKWLQEEEPLFVSHFYRWFGTDPTNQNSVAQVTNNLDLLPDGYILPFTVGETWYYTSGPHNYDGGQVGCISGANCPRPWSSIDIASKEVISCPNGRYLPYRWAVAAQSGSIISAENNFVVIDHHDGWRTYYLHLDGIVVEENANVNQGDPLGHPSCMGGITYGIHLHFAIWRESIGFIDYVDINGSSLSSWTVREATHYNGEIDNNDITKVADTGRSSENAISNFPYDDNFNTNTLSTKWLWVREDPSHWYLSDPIGYLTIITQHKDIWRYDTSAPILYQDLKTFTPNVFSVSTRIKIFPQENFHQGGLVIYANDDNHIRLTYGYMDQIRIEFAKEVNGIFENLHTSPPLDVNDFHLKIIKLNNSYMGFYSLDGRNWISAGIWNNVQINPSKIGLTAFNGQEISTEIEIPAQFDYFELRDGYSLFIPLIIK